MILAPSPLLPAERAEGRYLLWLRSFDAATWEDEAELDRVTGSIERSLQVLCTLQREAKSRPALMHVIPQHLSPSPTDSGPTVKNRNLPGTSTEDDPSGSAGSTATLGRAASAGERPGGSLALRVLGRDRPADVPPSCRRLVDQPPAAGGSPGAANHRAVPSPPHDHRRASVPVDDGHPGVRRDRIWPLAAVWLVAGVLLIQLARGGWS